jgi:hypothetical protein
MHIILVLALEGILLFYIFMPMIYGFVDVFSNTAQNIIHNQNYPNSNIKPEIVNPVNSNIPESINNLVHNSENFYIVNPYFISGKWLDSNYNFENPEVKKPYWIDNPDYKVFTPIQKNIMGYGVIGETMYSNYQQYVPYVIYGALILGLIALSVILVVISNKYNIKLDYKFTFINSVIVFFFALLYIASFLFYGIFSQEYVVNIEKKIIKKVLESDNSA